jgi:hypothetical protein
MNQFTKPRFDIQEAMERQAAFCHFLSCTGEDLPNACISGLPESCSVRSFGYVHHRLGSNAR